VTILYKAVLPFIGLLVVALLITTYVPQLALSIVPGLETEFSLFDDPAEPGGVPTIDGDGPLDLDSLEDEFEGKPLKDTLLTPTRIYVKEFKENMHNIVALAHITGGGIIENLPRVLPEGIKAVVRTSDIRVLPIFEFIAQHVDREEMFRAFNMGVGMVWVVEPENVDAVLAMTDGYVIGHTETGDKKVEMI
jgi:phosphoribosylaminoimidazole (AIR) synthetase